MQSTEVSPSGKWSILSVICLGTLMTTIDGSIVNIALPTIANAFGEPLNGKVQWTIIVYLVTLASTLLAFGKLADTYGAKRIWSAGILLFTLGSVACGFAPSLLWLILFRGVQAFGASMMLAPSAALISHTFSAAERGKALGINSVVVSIGVSSGPIMGGYLTDYLSWHWIFFINLPIGIVTYFWTLRVLPDTTPSTREPQSFDALGGLLIALGLGGLTLGLSFGTEWGWSSPYIITALVVGTLASAAAYRVERRAPNPLIDLSLFDNRMFTLSFFTLLLCSMTIVTIVFLLPFYYEQLLGLSTSRSGLLMTPASIAIGLVGPFAGRLSDKYGSDYLVPAGLSLSALSIFLLYYLDSTTAISFVVGALVLSGVGRGLFFPANSSTLMNNTPVSGLGTGSSMLSTGRMIGQSLGIALTGAVFVGLGGAQAGNALEGRGGDPALQEVFTQAFGSCMLVACAIGIFAVVLSLLRSRTHGKLRVAPPTPVIEPPAGLQ